MSDEPQMQSMDRFGPVSADYFNQHKVVAVRRGVDLEIDGAGDIFPEWAIEFDNGGYIFNYDPMVPKPTAIAGAALTQVVMSKAGTELRFGLEQVVLNPMEWAMQHPTYTRGIIVFAQRSDWQMPVQVPPHDDDRTRDRRQFEEDDDGA